MKTQSRKIFHRLFLNTILILICNAIALNIFAESLNTNTTNTVNELIKKAEQLLPDSVNV